MSSDNLKLFAEELKSHREKTGISLQQISQSTKIDIKFLKSIEEGNFDILPEIYIKAFIKEYSKCIDLNPDEIISKYQSAKNGNVSAKIESSQQEIDNEKKEIGVDKVLNNNNILKKIAEHKKIKLSVKLNYIIGTFILLAAFAILYYSLTYSPKTEIIAEKDEPLKNEDRFEIEKPDTSNQINQQDAIVNDDSLKLSISTLENVWIKVIKDGKNVHQKMTIKDSKLNFKAKEKFSVSVGNAAAVKILYNGNEIKNIGKFGEIKNITITPDTIKFLTIKRNDKKSN